MPGHAMRVNPVPGHTMAAMRVNPVPCHAVACRAYAVPMPYQCRAMPTCALPCCTMPFNVVPCRLMPCHAMLCHALTCRTQGGHNEARGHFTVACTQLTVAGAGARVAHTPHVDALSPPKRAVLAIRE